MPINATTDYFVAEKKYQEASSSAEKLKALQEMFAYAPKHKGTQKLLDQIKKRIAREKEQIQKSKKSSKGRSLSIKKEGDAQIAFIGLPNSGKSYILEKLSGAEVKQDQYPFTTKNPVVRTISVGGAKIQGIEMPAIYKGAYESERGPELFGLIRNADLVVLVVDGSKVVNNQVDELISELSKADIKLTAGHRSQSGLEASLPGIILVNRDPDFSGTIRGLKVINVNEDTSNTLWLQLGKIRVYTKTGPKVAPKPVVLKNGTTIKDLAFRVHKDFVKKFRYAKIFGPSAKFEGQQVGLDHKLKDKDVVEIYID